jgi:hypothetical protein
MVLGIEAIPNQNTPSRFFGKFSVPSCQRLCQLHAWTLRELPSSARPHEGYKLDRDSMAQLHEEYVLPRKNSPPVPLPPLRFRIFLCLQRNPAFMDGTRE